MFPCWQGVKPTGYGHLTTPATRYKTLQFNCLCALDATLLPPVLFSLMGAKSRKWWLLGLGVVLLGYLLYHSRHLLNLSQFSGVKLWHAIRGADYTYLLVSVVVIYLCYAVRAWRWQKFQKHVGHASFWNIYAMNLAGFSALFLLGRAAEPLRPLLISRKDKIPLADTFGIYALERILDAASTAVLAAIGLLVFESFGRSSADGTAQAFEKAARTAGTVFSLLALFAITALVYLRLHGTAVLERRMQGWLAAHGWRAGFARIVLGFSRGVQTVRTWGDLVAAVLLSALHWCLVVVVYFLVTKSFGGKLGTLTFTDAMLGACVHHGGFGRATSRRGRRRASALHRCIHAIVWSRTGSSSCLCDGVVAGHVCFVHACRCAHPVPGRMVARRVAPHEPARRRADRRRNRRAARHAFVGAGLQSGSWV